MPIQMCHFHMQAIITRMLTKNPRLEASIRLKKIVLHLDKIRTFWFEYWPTARYHFFAGILYLVSLTYVPLFIGVYILLSLWSHAFNQQIKHYKNYYLIGFLRQGSLSS